MSRPSKRARTRKQAAAAKSAASAKPPLAKPAAASAKKPAQSLWARLGPGLITGAADDDPSGIATYSQVGAGFGYSILWTTLLTFPLMVGIQTVSARIGRVTGHGLAANIRHYYPRPVLYGVVLLLLLANTINIAADIGAMGAALALLIGGNAHWYGAAFGVLSAVLQVFIPFRRYAPILKALTLALFIIEIPWGEVAVGTLLPKLSLRPEYIVAVVAVFGTTISPYLFFWQASQEVEEQRAARGEKPLVEAPEQARAALKRIKLDTYIGMAFSNLVAFCIMLTAVTTLHLHGITDIQNSSQAAQALRPIAGDFAFLLFSAGIIGTGLLAVPVLAGSAAYGIAEAFRWRNGLGLDLAKARGFYGIIILATALGIGINFTPIDPIKALFWSAVINGVVAVPVMIVMMLMARKKEIMGAFVVKRRSLVLGWAATAVMAVMVVAMFATWGG
jgi:NRAMP (natural resistance-associated macrophage protein)-like metal ion transporter